MVVSYLEPLYYSSHNGIHGVIFDVGGVVLTSPLIAISEYESERNFPKDWVNILMHVAHILYASFTNHPCSTGHGEQGAWQRFERGELDLQTFYREFSTDLSNVAKGKVWYAKYCSRKGISMPVLPAAEEMKVDGRELFGRMMRGSQFDPLIVNAINKIRGKLSSYFPSSQTERPSE